MLKETIKNDLVSAMKDKNKVLLNTLRSVKGAVQLEIINNKKEDCTHKPCNLFLCKNNAYSTPTKMTAKNF